MATDGRIGRRELISRVLAGGLAAGTFALTGFKGVFASQQRQGKPQKNVVTLDITTIGEERKVRTCDSYNTKRFECTKYRAYRNASKACRERFSARCGFFFCH